MAVHITSKVLKNDGLIEHLERIVQNAIDKSQPCFLPLVRMNDCAVVLNVDIFNAIVLPEYRVTEEMAAAIVKLVEDFEPDDFKHNDSDTEGAVQ